MEIIKQPTSTISPMAFHGSVTKISAEQFIIDQEIEEYFEIGFYYISSDLLYPLFSLEKKGILILCQSRSVVRPSVRPCY